MKKTALVFLMAISLAGCLKPCYTCTTTITATAPGIAPQTTTTSFEHCGNPREVEGERTTVQETSAITVTAKSVTRCRL